MPLIREAKFGYKENMDETESLPLLVMFITSVCFDFLLFFKPFSFSYLSVNIFILTCKLVFTGAGDKKADTLLEV